MLFRFINAPVIYQQFINDTFIKYLDIFIVVYLDNILIYLKIFEEHVKYIKIILGKLAPRKLMVKKKCDFYKYKIDFLGFIIEREGIKINFIKIKKILDWLESKNIIEF